MRCPACDDYLQVAVNDGGQGVVACPACRAVSSLEACDLATRVVVEDLIHRDRRHQRREETADRAELRTRLAPWEGTHSEGASVSPSTESIPRIPDGDGPRTHPKGGVADHW